MAPCAGSSASPSVFGAVARGAELSASAADAGATGAGVESPIEVAGAESAVVAAGVTGSGAGVTGSGATSGFGGADAAGVGDSDVGEASVADDCAALASTAAVSVPVCRLGSVDTGVAADEAVPAADGASADSVCVRSSLTVSRDASRSADGAALGSPAAGSVPVGRLGSVDAGGAVPRLSAAPVSWRRDGSAACESPLGRVPDACAEPSSGRVPVASGRVPVGGTDPSARPSPRTCAPLLARTTGRDSGSRSTMPPVRSRRAEPSPVIAASSHCRAGSHSPHCPRHSRPLRPNRPRHPNHSRSPNRPPRPVRPGADGGRRRRSRRPHRR